MNYSVDSVFYQLGSCLNRIYIDRFKNWFWVQFILVSISYDFRDEIAILLNANRLEWIVPPDQTSGAMEATAHAQKTVDAMLDPYWIWAGIFWRRMFFLKIPVFVYHWRFSVVRARCRDRQRTWWTPVSTCRGGTRRRISSWSSA